jgi:hypothetical protein
MPLDAESTIFFNQLLDSIDKANQLAKTRLNSLDNVNLTLPESMVKYFASSRRISDIHTLRQWTKDQYLKTASEWEFDDTIETNPFNLENWSILQELLMEDDVITKTHNKRNIRQVTDATDGLITGNPTPKKSKKDKSTKEVVSVEEKDDTDIISTTTTSTTTRYSSKHTTSFEHDYIKSKVDECKTKDGGKIDAALIRIKFNLNYTNATLHNTITKGNENSWRPLSKALQASEEVGAAPVAPDGKVCGNGAVLIRTAHNNHGDDEEEVVLVSKSGKKCNLALESYSPDEFVVIKDFSKERWEATYSSSDADIRPSSDTPLLWNCLKVAPKLFNWKLRPLFILHGHTCATEEEAACHGFPCSPEETLFSTPADLEALMTLFEQYPYPEHQCYVRKNHGFFLLAQSEEEAIQVLRSKLYAK